MTEAQKLPMIKREGMLNPTTGTRGVRYRDYRLHFFTSLNPEVVEEVESFIRFGGLPYDDNLWNHHAKTPLVILELDMKELAEFDEQMEWKRIWNDDPSVTEGAAVWTPYPVPITALTTIRELP